MAKQDGWKPREVQLEPLLPIPSRSGTHYEELQEFVRPFGSAGPRRKVEAIVAPFYWPGEANWFGSLEGCFFKTSSRND